MYKGIEAGRFALLRAPIIMTHLFQGSFRLGTKAYVSIASYLILNLYFGESVWYHFLMLFLVTRAINCSQIKNSSLMASYTWRCTSSVVACIHFRISHKYSLQWHPVYRILMWLMHDVCYTSLSMHVRLLSNYALQSYITLNGVHKCRAL